MVKFKTAGIAIIALLIGSTIYPPTLSYANHHSEAVKQTEVTQTIPPDVKLTVANKFPNGLQFNLTFTPINEIEEVRLRYKLVGQTNKSSYRTLSIDKGLDPITATFSIQSGTSNDYIPPGTKIEYWIELWTTAGDKLENEPNHIIYLDSKYEWLAVENKNIIVYYSDTGMAKKAKTVLEITQSTLDNIQSVYQVTPIDRFRLVLYESYPDMQKALPFRSKTIQKELVTQGMAFSEERSAVIYAHGNTFKSTTSHEFMHLLTHEYVGRFHTRIPSWLDEGLAEYGNLFQSNDYATPLKKAVADETTKPLKFLNVFTGEPEDIIVAYGKGKSVVTYLAENYGPDSIGELLRQLASVPQIENAVLQTYGRDLTTLDKEWLEDFLGTATETKPSAEVSTPLEKLNIDPLNTDQVSTINRSCGQSGPTAPYDVASLLVLVSPLILVFYRRSA